LILNKFYEKFKLFSVDFLYNVSNQIKVFPRQFLYSRFERAMRELSKLELSETAKDKYLMENHRLKFQREN